MDAHEEKDLWTKICNGIKELAAMSKRSQEIENELAQEQERLGDGSSRVAPRRCPLLYFSRFLLMIVMSSCCFIYVYELSSFFFRFYMIIFHVKFGVESNSIFKIALGQNGNR